MLPLSRWYIKKVQSNILSTNYNPYIVSLSLPQAQHNSREHSTATSVTGSQVITYQMKSLSCIAKALLLHIQSPAAFSQVSLISSSIILLCCKRVSTTLTDKLASC